MIVVKKITLSICTLLAGFYLYYLSKESGDDFIVATKDTYSELFFYYTLSYIAFALTTVFTKNSRPEKLIYTFCLIYGSFLILYHILVVMGYSSCQHSISDGY